MPTAPNSPPASAGWHPWRGFLVSLTDLPSVNWHAFHGALLAWVYVVTVLVGVVLGRDLSRAEPALYAVGAFILAYLGKASYDFAKKRGSDADTIIAGKLAANVTPADAAAMLAPSREPSPIADAPPDATASGAVDPFGDRSDVVARDVGGAGVVQTGGAGFAPKPFPASPEPDANAGVGGIL